MRLEVQADDELDDKTLEVLEQRHARTWGGGGPSGVEDARVSVGERLQGARRLMVLGDPGAGKSTLLRWLATAYLLRLQKHPDWRNLPDITSLPDRDWLPILIRCRDLPPGVGTLDEMLQHSLRKSELAADQCIELAGLLRTRLERGEALLLVDGLDEITEPGARARFARQLEQVHRAFAQAPMVVTSRIVGYREMGYRIRSGFEHLTVTDLSREDKDAFARRWCRLTERPERHETAAQELIRDIHTSDRIERLTGNPMLLTTMALIKRKIGRLPQRRVDLYEKAVEVLLNWRAEVDTPLDPREVLPQLEYLAHAMCADEVQRLRDDQLLALLRQVRQDYPAIHSMGQHSPEAFLGLLERRTGLLIQSGHTRHNGRSVAVYEFRHLTFQEYLAGIALVQGHYRRRDPRQTLAEAIAPLAGKVEKISIDQGFVVVENWREALRLCVASCNDDDVDSILLAILNPLDGEIGSARARAVQAALCLADEPNVGDAVAEDVLRGLVHKVGLYDAVGSTHTTLDTVVATLANSRWARQLARYVLEEYSRCDPRKRNDYAALYLMVRESQQVRGKPSRAN
jgi:predicted NACHT family NTPase